MPNIEDFISSFPSNPSFKGAWVSIYFEPILASEERFTVAVAAIGKDETYKVVPTIRKDIAEIMFGEKNKAYLNIANLICESLTLHIESKKKISGWAPPISGIHTGAIRETYSTSLDGLIKQAISLTSSLSEIDTVELEEAIISNYIDKQVSNNTAWQESFRSAVLEKNPKIYKNFNKKFDFPNTDKPLKIFYLSSKIAMNTGKLLPGKNISSDFNIMKAKLFDLLAVRDNEGHLSNRKSHELIVFTPEIKNDLSSRQISSFQDSIKILEETADKHELRVCAVKSLDRAVERILNYEAA